MSTQRINKWVWFSFGCLVGSLTTAAVLSSWQPFDAFSWPEFPWNDSESSSNKTSDSSSSLSCTYLDQASPPWLSFEKASACHWNQIDIPTTLEKRSKFWKQVWGEVPDRLYLLVDERRPWITYKWVDCRDFFKFGKADEFKEELCDHKLLAAKKQLVRKLLRQKRRPKGNFVKLFDNHRGLARTAYRHIQVVQGRKDSLTKAITLYSKYSLEVESVFQAQGAPPCLARVSIIESLADPMAISSAGAVGAFQFVDSTARKYLIITEHVDERLDPLREGWAAARYLKKLYDDFKTWPLALTAYNTGPTRLRRLIKRRRTMDLATLVNRGTHGSFGFQSQNYYAQFIAVLKLTATGEVSPPSETAKSFVRLSKAMSLSQLAACLRSTKTGLAMVNPALGKAIVDKEELIPTDYLVGVPQEVFLSVSDGKT